MMVFRIAFWAILLLHFFRTAAYAQYENIWVFGNRAGLDFNSGVPVAIETEIRGGGGAESNASVCDANGQLLFYTEGSYVWDRNHKLMPNGNNLIVDMSNVLGNSLTASTTQGSLIVPVPGSANQYYIFSNLQIELGNKAGRLYYSIIDITLNGGMGDVLPGKKGLLLDSNLTEKMIGIAGDRCNMWVLVHHKIKNEFKAWELTVAGISAQPAVSQVGHMPVGVWGHMTISSDRKKLVNCNANIQILEVFDFDPETGIVSNPIVLDQSNGYYGAAFSPDGTKVYANTFTTSSIYQFDLTAADIPASRTWICPGIKTDIKLAPDGKLYLTDYISLGRINEPNVPGVACRYENNSIRLLAGTNIGWGLPNAVPIWLQGSKHTTQVVQAPCFVNNNFFLQALEQENTWGHIWNTGVKDKVTPAGVPGTYWVTYNTPPCMEHVDTYQVSFANGVLPQLNIQSACRKESNARVFAYTYPEDTVTYSYAWKNIDNHILSVSDTLQGVRAGYYSLQIKTQSCDTTLHFSIPEVDERVHFQVDSIGCMGTALDFRNSSASHFSHFNWWFGDGTTDTVRHPNKTYTTAGVYTIRFIGTGPICTDTAMQTILIDPHSNGQFYLEPDTICIGESIQFHTERDSLVLTQNWSFGDESLITMTPEITLQHAYQQPGLMLIRLTSRPRACPDTMVTRLAYVHALPSIDLGPDQALCRNAAPLVLQNLYPATAARYQYQWSTGDTTAQLKVTYPGSYSLRLSLESLGCAATETVLVHKDCYADLPNAFTPNGDGSNDHFFPKLLLTQKINRLKLQVFNRWGQCIFETSNIDSRGWDGRFNGLPQEAAVYPFVLSLEMEGQVPEQYTGNVTLIR